MSQEPFDVYTDSFVVATSVWGTNLIFDVREPHPTSATGSATSSLSRRLGTVRMSNEQLKVLVFMCYRHMTRQEGELGFEYDLPEEILNQLSIPVDEWNNFWSLEEDD